MLILWGVFFNIRLARKGLVLAMVGGCILGLGLLIDVWRPLQGIQAILWVGFSIVTLAMIGEPGNNPITCKDGNDK